MDSKILLVADIASTQMMLMAAERTGEGTFRVIAVEQETTPEDSVQYGIIQSASTIAAKLTEMMRKMENRLRNVDPKYKIRRVFVGFSGRSLRTVRCGATREYSSPLEISQAEMTSLLREIESRRVEGKLRYAVFTEEFVADGEYLRNPEGVVCKELTGNYLVVYGREDINLNYEKMIDRFQMYGIENCGLAPIAMANAVTTSDDRRKGCAVIDFGEALTTVAVFQDEYLRHLAVIPFGTNNVVRDLCDLGLTYKEAEKAKSKYTSLAAPERDQRLSYGGGAGTETRVVLMSDMVKVTYARVDEIMDMVIGEIENSCYSSRLEAGIIVGGDGLRINGMVDYIRDKTKMAVREASHSHQLASVSVAEYSDSRYSQLVGLLMNCGDMCVELEEEKTENHAESAQVKADERKKPKVKKIGGGFFGFVDNMFGDDKSIDE